MGGQDNEIRGTCINSITITRLSLLRSHFGLDSLTKQKNVNQNSLSFSAIAAQPAYHTDKVILTR